MKRLAMFLVVALCAITFFWRQHALAAATADANQPSYTAEGKLQLPTNYREWVFLSSGFGMNYSNGSGSRPAFTNVFVTPDAYKGFKATGKWPDKSMFVVEIYSPSSSGSINKSGYYQSAFMGLDVEVKDSSRPEQWSYYNFDPGATSARALGGGCNKCHNENGAVEHTFVQFYPTLIEVARKNGTLKTSVDSSQKP